MNNPNPALNFQRPDRDLSVFERRGWLADVPPTFRAAVLARCDIMTVEGGTSIYHMGDEAGGIYGVVEGQFGICGAVPGAAPTLAHLVGPGFWTGEFAAATRQTRIVSLIARSPGRLLRLPRAQFLRIAETDPLAWRYLAGLVALNMERAIMIVYALRCHSAPMRLAATLVNLAREVEDLPALIRVSQFDLGVLAQLSRGSVNAGLTVLECEGLILREYGALSVPDIQALADFASA